jgi:hypothetical protein
MPLGRHGFVVLTVGVWSHHSEGKAPLMPRVPPRDSSPPCLRRDERKQGIEDAGPSRGLARGPVDISFRVVRALMSGGSNTYFKTVTMVGGAIGLMVVCVLLFNYASTTNEEKEGLLGISWAANIRDLPDMQLIAEDGDHRYYTRSRDEFKVEGITVDKIVYGFYKGRFFNVMAYFGSKPSFAKMKDRLTSRYGAPYKPDETDVKFFWTVDTVHLLLTYDEATNLGRVSYFYQPIEGEIEQSEKAKGEKASPGA